MPNWASVEYVVRGKKEDINSIFNALDNPVNSDDPSVCWDKTWEGGVLKTLGFSEKELDNHSLRGFVQDYYVTDDNLLYIYSDEAWSLTDFSELLSSLFADLEIFWYLEEPGLEIYATNDVDGEYFQAEYVVEYYKDYDLVDTYYPESEDDLYNLLSTLTEGVVTDEKSLEKFNDNEDTYFNIHKIEVK